MLGLCQQQIVCVSECAHCKLRRLTSRNGIGDSLECIKQLSAPVQDCASGRCLLQSVAGGAFPHAVT